MNCDCLYWNAKATKEDLIALAKKIDSRCVELYPYGITTINGEYEYTHNYDGYGRRHTLPDESMVLVAGGKYHHMMEKAYRVGKIWFHPIFVVPEQRGDFCRNQQEKK